jgi:hypothetical protein
MAEVSSNDEIQIPKIEVCSIDVDGESVEGLSFMLDQFDPTEFDKHIKKITSTNPDILDKAGNHKFKFVICGGKVVVAPIKSPTGETVHHRMLFGENYADKIQDAGAINVRLTEDATTRVLGGFSSEYYNSAGDFAKYREQEVKPKLGSNFSVLGPYESMP